MKNTLPPSRTHVRKGWIVRIVNIPKRNGKFRTIYIPNKQEREGLYKVLPKIARKAKQQAGGVVHGFVRGRSIVTAATHHIGRAWTMTVDIRDFFDSCNEAMLKGKLSKEELEVVLVDGAPRQGLPTSPAVANLAAQGLDAALIKFTSKNNIVYTRYADDLTFSGDTTESLELLKVELPRIVGRCGFKLAPEKTEIYWAKAGRRMVLGVDVGNEGIHPSRKMKRRLRAALHQKNTAQAEGLAEYCKLKPPKELRHEYIRDDNIIDELKALQKQFRLGNIGVSTLPHKHDPIPIGPHMEITADPVQMLGMSLYTTGWTSCHNIQRGSRKRGPIFWMHLQGTSLAVFYHESKKESYAGVERRLMRARTLIHTMEDGSKYHDRVYGEFQGQIELRDVLLSLNINHIHNAPKGLRVVGRVPNRRAAYFDNLHAKTVTVRSGGKVKKYKVCYK